MISIAGVQVYFELNLFKPMLAFARLELTLLAMTMV
jgi:fumarate hydratase class II